MRIQTIGVLTGVAALLLSGGTAFAENGNPSTSGETVHTQPLPENASEHMGGRMMPPNGSSTAPRPEDHRPMMASTTVHGDELDRRMMSSSTMEHMMDARQMLHDRIASTTKRIQEIKDKAKQDAATKLATQFADLNQKWTTEFSKQLDQMEGILGKIEVRAAADAQNGRDTSSTTAAVTTARTAIQSARDAVAAQVLKTYAVDPTTLPTTGTSTSSGQEKMMKTLRQSFQAIQKSLFKDLFALRDGPMKDARKAVQAAARTLGGSDNERNATTTESHTNP